MTPKLLTGHLMSGNTVYTAVFLEVGTDLWLVQSWLQSPDGKLRKPERAIRVDGFPAQAGVYGGEVLVGPVPKDVLHLDRAALQAAGCEWVEGDSDRLPPIEWSPGH